MFVLTKLHLHFLFISWKTYNTILWYVSPIQHKTYLLEFFDGSNQRISNKEFARLKEINCT